MQALKNTKEQADIHACYITVVARVNELRPPLIV